MQKSSDMKTDKSDIENTLREMQLWSHGRLLSSFSHELNNHIAIIQASAGLLQDYIDMGRIDDTDLCSKLEGILNRLEERIDQIGNMTTTLNSFSHRFDTPFSQFDLGKILQEQLFFVDRFARLKKITVETTTAQESIMISNSPGLLHYIIFFLFQSSVEVLPENSTMKIELEKKDSTATLRFILEGSIIPEKLNIFDNLPQEVELCLKKANGQLLFSPSGKSMVEHITVIFPVSC